MTDQTNPDDLKKCPLCAEPIKRKAIFCKHCQSPLQPGIQPDSSHAAEITAANPQLEHSDRSAIPDSPPAVSLPKAGLGIFESSFLPVAAVICVVLFAGAGFVLFLGHNTSFFKHDATTPNTTQSIVATKNNPTLPTDTPTTSGLQEDASSQADNSHNDGDDPLIDRILQASRRNDDREYNDLISTFKMREIPAVGDVEEATRLNKSGLTNLKAAKYAEAAADFESASAADQSDPKYLSNLGYSEMFAGDLDLAKKHLYASLAIDPSRSIAWSDLALVFAKLEHKDRAVSAFLLGNKLSEDKSSNFLKSLAHDGDDRVREASQLALNELPHTPDVNPAEETIRVHSIEGTFKPASAPTKDHISPLREIPAPESPTSDPSPTAADLTPAPAKSSDQMTLVGVIDGAATFATPSGTITLHVGESYQNVRIKAIDKTVDGVSVMLEDNRQLTTKTLRQKTTP